MHKCQNLTSVNSPSFSWNTNATSFEEHNNVFASGIVYSSRLTNFSRQKSPHCILKCQSAYVSQYSSLSSNTKVEENKKCHMTNSADWTKLLAYVLLLIESYRYYVIGAKVRG